MKKEAQLFPHPSHPRLVIFQRKDSKWYWARTFLDGKLERKSLKTDHLPTAFKLAADWYKKTLRASVDVGRNHPIDRLSTEPTIKELFTSYKAELIKKQQDYADMKWSTIADFWRTVTVTEVTPQTFKEFYKWRRSRRAKPGMSTTVKNNTIHKDVILIRQILKHAIENGHISSLPLIPKIGKIDANPRPWLTHPEYEHLLEVSQKRIDGASDNTRLHSQRSDLHDLIVFLVHSMVRVGELQTLRFRDCRIEEKGQREILLCEVAGKRGHRTVVSTPIAAQVFARRKEAAESAEGLIFPEHHRDGFRELLDAAGLRTDKKTGFHRNLKSLRATAISFRILAEPNPNLLLIARNAGTSLQMIDQFYAARLSSMMGLESLSRDLTLKPKKKVEDSKQKIAAQQFADKLIDFLLPPGQLNVPSHLR